MSVAANDKKELPPTVAAISPVVAGVVKKRLQLDLRPASAP
jgi:hypothetical protein